MSYTYNGNTVYYFGDSHLESVTDLRFRHGRAQVYGDMLNRLASSGEHFVDDEFPHDESSVGDIHALFDTANPSILKMVTQWKALGWNGSATWIRVADVCKRIYRESNAPCFNCGDIGKTICRHDVQQGRTGDCWFLSSVADIAMIKFLIENVVPTDNSTNDQGIYHFRLWYQGAWVDVVVDDYLPCIVTNYYTLTLGTNLYPNEGKAEFWPTMLEKAFAKLNGSYQNIAGNCIMYGQEFLTGGFGQFLQTNKDVGPNTYDKILKFFDRACVVGAGTRLTADGIHGNHAYSVTGAHVVTANDGTQHKLLRCRNPWGNTEWTGKWSDASPCWNDVSNEQKEEIRLKIQNDGEFWISYEDFLTHFTDINAAFYYDANDVNHSDSGYHFAQFNTSWSVSANTSGGWESPWQNPLFEVEVVTTNPTGDLIVGLLVQGKLKQRLEHQNCIRVYPAGTATTYDENFFRHTREIHPPGHTSVPANSFLKSYCQFYVVTSGKYIVVPTSLLVGDEQQIVVRILNEGHEAARAVAPGGGNTSGSESASE